MQFLILAVSYKNNNLCVAGLDIETNNYVRIYEKGMDTISINTLNINGRMCEMLDIIDITVTKLPDSVCQVENYELIKINYFVKTITTKELDIIYNKLYHPKYIFNDLSYAIDSSRIQNIKESIILVKVFDYKIEEFEVQVAPNTYKIKRKALFTYNDFIYTNISVTNSIINNKPYQYTINVSNRLTKNFGKEAYLLITLPNKAFTVDNKFYKYLSGFIFVK